MREVGVAQRTPVISWLTEQWKMWHCRRKLPGSFFPVFYFDRFSNFYPLVFSPSCICVKLVCTVSVGTQRASLQKWKILQVYFCQSLYVRWEGWIYCGVLVNALICYFQISQMIFFFISFSKSKPNPFGLGLNFWLVRQTNWSAPGFFSRGAGWFSKEHQVF